MTDYLAYTYAAAVAAGGVIGYVKKGSMMSGIMVNVEEILCVQIDFSHFMLKNRFSLFIFYVLFCVFSRALHLVAS